MDPQWLIEELEEYRHQLQFLDSSLTELKELFHGAVALEEEYVLQTEQQCAVIESQINHSLEAYRVRVEKLEGQRNQIVSAVDDCRSKKRHCEKLVSDCYDVEQKWSLQRSKCKDWLKRESIRLKRAQDFHHNASDKMRCAEDELKAAEKELIFRLQQRILVSRHRTDGSTYTEYVEPEASHEKARVARAKSSCQAACRRYEESAEEYDKAFNAHEDASKRLKLAISSLHNASEGKKYAELALDDSSHALNIAIESQNKIETAIKQSKTDIEAMLQALSQNAKEQATLLSAIKVSHADSQSFLQALEQDFNAHIHLSVLFQNILRIKAEQLNMFDFTE